jgi:hypothetical protein
MSLARFVRFALLVAIAILAALIALGTVATAHAQTSPARGPVSTADDMPLADYLGLLQQLAPAAAEGAKVYLAAYRLQCGRTLSTGELRQVISKEGGDPVLMGLIRATQEQNTAQRTQWVRQIRCTSGGMR